jgi:HEAT repeat protein
VTTRALTHALTQDATAEAALGALCRSGEPAAVEALVELLARPHSAALALPAVRALAGIEGPPANQALLDALLSPLPSVRQAAAEGLAPRKVARAHARLFRLLREDGSWPVRRAALEALADLESWAIYLAADDPHWRVRHALVNHLLAWAGSPSRRGDVFASLHEYASRSARTDGLAAYLRWRWSGERPFLTERPGVQSGPFDDPDPFVLQRFVEERGEDGLRPHLAELPSLLTAERPRVRALARQTLARHARTEDLIAAVARLDDQREGAADEVAELMRSVEQDRIEEAARRILHASDASTGQLAWAIDQVGAAFPVEEESERCEELFAMGAHHPRVRAALARLATRWPENLAFPWLDAMAQAVNPVLHAEIISALRRRGWTPTDEDVRDLTCSADPAVRAAAIAWAGPSTDLDALAQDEDASVRVALAARLRSAPSPTLAFLQFDSHPLVRAAALTQERAAALVADPEQETSWHVLHAACRLAKTPAWKLEPRPPWRPPPRAEAKSEPMEVPAGDPPNARRLGPDGLTVPPVGLSGHYGLPVDGFVRAVERGLNFLFWEPNYQTLTAFSSRLSPSSRRQLNFLCGTFEATPQRLLADVERALRALRAERIALFMVFWVRGWSRITAEMHSMLERLKGDGKVGTFGLSTHDRAFAIEAIDDGWDPVMVRHSLAHRGAESAVLPRGLDRGTSVITFNNTCYGRLLRPRDGGPAATAADCYRYSLMQPGVTACLSAPAHLAQLEETLAVAADPELPSKRLAPLLEHGAEVYREETIFRRTIRAL